MASFMSMITSKGFQNWVKGALAVRFTKQGLEDLVTVELTQFQKDLLTSIFHNRQIPSNTVCNLCSTENVLSCPTPNFCPRGRNSCNLHDSNLPNRCPNRPCPKGVCQDIRNEIRREHRYNQPSWKNTDATGWCTDPLQIGKCYMPPDGYSSATTFADVDFNGMLSIIINNKRFENKIDADFDDKYNPNVCTEAREVGRQIRHAADMSISDMELSEYIDILTNLLSDRYYLATDPKAMEAVDNLNKLKTNTLNITTSDITTVLDEEFRASVARQQTDALQVISAEREEAKKKFLDDVRNKLNNLKVVTISDLDKIVATKIADFKSTVEEEKRNLADIITKGKEEIESEIRKGRDQTQVKGTEKTTEQNKLRQNLRDDLISFYRRYHSTISVSPIVEDNDVPIVDFYVQPSLNSVDIQRKFGNDQESNKKKKIRSYNDVFCQPDGSLYNDIYVTAKAGIGKSSFVKKICMVWCQAHRPIQDIENQFRLEDVQAMKLFEYMFLIPLRDIDTSVCQIDDMIYSQIISCLARHRRYNEEFLEDLLHESKCLVVLDGLDEWSHPESCKIGLKDENKLPHCAARENCSILTTTRPWKLEVLNLSTTPIDRHVEMNSLDPVSSKQLISNAVSLLNKRSLSLQPKKEEDFLRTLTTMKRSSIHNIPFIILQRVCLWFDGESFGESKCEIYSSILELTLARGLMKLSKQYWCSQKKLPGDKAFPNFLLSNDLCRSHFDLILTLGKVAFETLFCPERESSIVFDAQIVLSRMPEYTLTFCLKIGLLSQNKDCRYVAKKRRTVSFQHKSVQEFLAALYIQTDPDNKDIQDMISKVCCTLSGVLEMSNVLAFLGGFSSSACGKTLEPLQNVTSNDENVIFYRENLQIKEFGVLKLRRTKRVVRAFQALQTDIVQEIKSSGQTEFPLLIEDIIIDNTTDKASYPLLKILIENNRDNIKSLCLRDFPGTEEFTGILSTTGLSNLHCLQKLEIAAVPRSEDLLSMLLNSVNTLKLLRLTFVEFRENLYYPTDTTLSSDIVQAVRGMKQLKALILNNIRLKHTDIKDLFETVCERNTMTEIGLYNITCTDHENECCGELLDLSQHQLLKHLSLDKIPVADLRVNTSSLYECLVGEDRDSVFLQWSECLKNSSDLYSLYFRRMTTALLDALVTNVPQMVHLTKLNIELSNIEDRNLILSPKTNLNSVYLYRVDLTADALRRLADSAAEVSHPVRVTLEWCTVTPSEDFDKVKDYIRTSSKYNIKFDGSKYKPQSRFEFETVVETTVTSS